MKHAFVIAGAALVMAVAGCAAPAQSVQENQFELETQILQHESHLVQIQQMYAKQQCMQAMLGHKVSDQEAQEQEGPPPGTPDQRLQYTQCLNSFHFNP